MADATSPFDRPSSPPRDWAQAFAALPEETPPADAWPALATRARHGREARRRRAWRSGFALAATLACAAFGLALWSMQVGQRAADAEQRHAAATDADMPADTRANPHADTRTDARANAQAETEADTQPNTQPNTQAERVAEAAHTADAGDAAHAAHASQPPAALQDAMRVPARGDARIADGTTMQASTPTARRTSLPGPRRGERPRKATPPRLPAADTLALPVERRLAGIDAEFETGTTADIITGTTTGTDSVPPAAAVSDAPAPSFVAGPRPESGDSRLQRLQARSAELEAWLRLLRDPSVGTGPGALIAAELDDRLAGIDAALAVVPGESADLQRELWQARVAALQRALAFESELRALAADGREYDGALVAVD